MDAAEKNRVWELMKQSLRDTNNDDTNGNDSGPIIINGISDDYYTHRDIGGLFNTMGATASDTISISSIAAPSYTYTLASDTISIADTMPGSTLSLSGEDADIEINGVSLMATLQDIQTRLNMLQPNLELEQEWEELRKLGDQYRALEKKCEEKAEMWKKIKSMPAPEIE